MKIKRIALFLLLGLLFSENASAKNIKPLAIAMWDFSWIERRWAGAGYEDWDKALDELKERGYNAVRIDAFPHLVAENATREYTLLPVWDQQVWGSPAINNVQIQPSLNTFIRKCKERKIKVALSSWYREDVENIRMKITSPEKMAENWIKTLESIDKEGLLDAVVYVDFCNEWPGYIWAPFFKNEKNIWGYWESEVSLKYMRRSIEVFSEKFPEIPVLYSFDNQKVELYAKKDLSFFDLFEHHVWMVQQNNSEFYVKVGYPTGLFDSQGYKNVVAKAENLYREKPEYWKKLLTDKIDFLAINAKKANRTLITTECWGIVDYKDWPLLNWEWVKELCEIGTKRAAASGQWVGIATSNFCGPQFVGMWRDVAWHKRLTKIIKSSKVDESCINEKLRKRLE